MNQKEAEIEIVKYSTEIEDKCLTIVKDMFSHINKNCVGNSSTLEANIVHGKLLSLLQKVAKNEIVNDFRKDLACMREIAPVGGYMTSSSVLYVEDTPDNRKIMTENFGELMFDKMFENSWSYIQFNKYTRQWTPSMSYEWLYVPQPKLTTMEEILKYKK
jgi:hypothetical protein